jgi:hypothetical protein
MGAFEEMTTLHTNMPERASEREIKEIWRTENPNRNPDDFEGTDAARNWAAETKTWRDDFLTQASARWKAESPNLPALEKIDQQIGSGLALNDGQANKTYTSLKQRVDDTHLISSMPSYERGALKPLVEDAKEQILRNADNLAVVVKSARGLALEEIVKQARLDAKAAGKDPDAAEKLASDSWNVGLDNALWDIEKLLPEWEKLLADKALPDPDELQSLANRFDRAFGEFEWRHALYNKNGNNPPYAKYQLPATVSALSEKIASQFAAHLGQPSFSAAYSLMMEVPHSGTYEDSRALAKELNKKSLANGFKAEVEQFIQNLKKIKTLPDVNNAKTLKAEFDNIDRLAGKSAFEKWENAYNDVGSGDTKKQKKALPALYESTAKLAFQFKNYQQAIDRFLRGANSSNANLYAKPYVQTLDGFVTAITEKLATAQSLVG